MKRVSEWGLKKLGLVAYSGKTTFKPCSFILSSFVFVQQKTYFSDPMGDVFFGSGSLNADSDPDTGFL